jgi:hypothetical protein
MKPQNHANISRDFLNDQLFFFTFQPASISLTTVKFLASFNVLHTIHAQLTVRYIMLYFLTRFRKHVVHFTICTRLNNITFNIHLFLYDNVILFWEMYAMKHNKLMKR